MVGAQGLCPVSVGGVQPHQQPIGALPQRVEREQPFRVRHGSGAVTGRRGQLGELGQGCREPGREPFPLLDHPVIVGAIEQRAPVVRHRVPQAVRPAVGVGIVEQCLEVGDVDHGGRLGTPPQRIRRGLDSSRRRAACVRRRVCSR